MQSFTSKQVGAEVCCELHANKLNANINTQKKLKYLDKISAFDERESKWRHLGVVSLPQVAPRAGEVGSVLEKRRGLRVSLCSQEG